MKVSQRREPGRLVLRVEDIDPGDRAALDADQLMVIDIGRYRTTHPVTDIEAVEYVPVRVVYDPLGREWTPIVGTDTGTACELSTPMGDT